MEFNLKKISFCIIILIFKYFVEHSPILINCTKELDIYFKQSQTFNLNTDNISKVLRLREDKIVVATVNNTLLIFDINNNYNLLNTLSGHTDIITSLIQLSNGDIASAGIDKTIRVWDKSNDYSIRKILTDNQEIYSLAQTKSGLFITGYSNGSIKLWQTITESKNIGILSSPILCLSFFDKGMFATGSEDGLILMWDEAYLLDTFKRLSGHTKAVRSILQLDEGIIASSSDDCSIKIWNINNPSPLVTTINKHSEPVNSLVNLQNGFMASGSDDNMIFIWNTTDFSLNSAIQTDSKVNQLCYLDNKLLVSGHADGFLNVWDTNKNYSLSTNISGGSFAVTSMIQLKRGWIVSGFSDGTIRVFDTYNNYTLIITLKQNTDAVISLLELDNGMIVSGSADKTIKILDPDQRFSPIDTFARKKDSVTGLIQLYSGTIISSSKDDTITIWNITSKQIKMGHSDTITDLKLLNSVLISSSLDQTININNMYDNYKSIKTLKGHTGAVNAIEIIDDNLFASASNDTLIKVWNKTDNYNLVKTLVGHTHSVQSLCKLSDRVLLSAGRSTRLKIWNIKQDFEFIQNIEERTNLILAIDDKNFLTLPNSSYIDIYQSSNVIYFNKNNDNNFTLNEYIGSDNSTSIVFKIISRCGSTIFINSEKAEINKFYSPDTVFTYKGSCDSNIDELSYTYYYSDNEAQEKFQNENLTILFENGPYLWQPVLINGGTSEEFEIDFSDKIYDDKFSVDELKIEFLSLPTQGSLFLDNDEPIDIDTPYQVLKFYYENTNNTESNVIDSFEFIIINAHNVQSVVYSVNIALTSNDSFLLKYVFYLMSFLVGIVFVIAFVIHICKRYKFCCWKNKLGHLDVEKLKSSNSSIFSR